MVYRRVSGVYCGLSCVALVLSCQPGWSGAWTKPKGEGEVIVSGLYAEASERFGSDGDPYPIPVFRKADIHAHLEYGVADGWTAIGRSELRTEGIGEAFAIDEARFGLTGLGVRAGLWQGGGSVVSVEAIGRLAAGSDAGRKDGDVDLRLLGGHGFQIGEWSGFVDLQAAYRMRIGADTDELRADATVGLRPRPPLLFLLQSFNTMAIDRSFGVGDAREHKLQISAVYDVHEQVSVQIGGIATVAGRKALHEQGIVAAVWYRF